MGDPAAGAAGPADGVFRGRLLLADSQALPGRDPAGDPGARGGAGRCGLGGAGHDGAGQGPGRVGDKPLEALFWRLCTALSHGRAPWSHFAGLLVVAWDGNTVAVYDSPANAAAFGKPASPGKRRGTDRQDPGSGASPQIRLVTLVACGTRCLLDAAFGPLRGKGTGEQGPGGELTRSLDGGMLLLADRNSYSYALYGRVRAAGADVLWRVKQNNVRLPVVQVLPDGSWISRITDPAAAGARVRKHGQRRRRGCSLPPDTSPLPSVTVRVIAFTITVTGEDDSTRTEPYLLIPSLTDHRACPARQLADLYAWRWAIEQRRAGALPQPVQSDARLTGGCDRVQHTRQGRRDGAAGSASSSRARRRSEHGPQRPYRRACLRCRSRCRR